MITTTSKKHKPTDESTPLLSSAPSWDDSSLLPPPPPYSQSYESNHHDLQSKKMSKFPLNIPRLIKLSVVIMTVAICGFVAINIWLIGPHSQEYIEKSLDVEAKSVEFAGIGKGFSSVGINVQLETSFDYNKLNNSYLASVFQLNGRVFKSVDISLDDIEIKLLDKQDEDSNPQNIQDYLIKLGYMNIPPFNLRIEQQTPTTLDLLITLQPNRRELYRFLKKLSEKMQNGEKFIIFRLFAKSQMSLNLGIIPTWKKFPVDVDQTINLSPQMGSLESFLDSVIDFVVHENTEDGKPITNAPSASAGISKMLIDKVGKPGLNSLISLLSR
ncbi:hypothetical protein DASC09_056810 [Saccharomycopsis crataegensis]|uniref:Uncharacterized protein n=1 Tax=Saccharomycopsis crataegensis TaxID=43959 RepID=A0AAV5QUW3_9ASCO|nr:hypothetical protein DASC09_056810 [Saccharomycopsis crataegensis]